MSSQPIWKPSAERIDRSRMTDYMRYVNASWNRSFESYHELYDWSITEIADFWASIWDYSKIVHSHTYKSVLKGAGMLGAKWFDGARLNFAENLLRYRDDRTAIVYRNETDEPVRLTFDELYFRVARCAQGLKNLGVTEGDRVAGYITNRPETIIAMLAAAGLGAVWSSCSPDFGFKGVFDRFGQIEPKVLFTVDGYSYNGKRFSPLDRVRKLVEDIPSIDHVVVVGDHSDAEHEPIDKAVSFSSLIDNDAVEVSFAQLPFDHPVYIMYSSGTTGLPKCMVHGAGGTLLQHFKEHALHTDLSRDDVITYFTTCGWMMWNWLVSALQIGTTVLLYDGSPSYPDNGVLWRTIEEVHITVFGTSPKFLSVCQNSGIKPGSENDMSSLRAILSTGSPLSVENFRWVYSDVKADVQLSSISGGTDLISCFMLGNPILPVYPGEIQCRGLGMKVETYDDDGRPIVDQVGELVCTAPFVSMPVYFWNDPGGEKYRAAYFERFPGVWRHGDYIKITPHGGVVVYGRSDATLNPGGVRIGTAEIYAPVESMDEIEECIVIEQKRGSDSRIVLFVVPAEGIVLTEQLAEKIKGRIREQASPRHVPALVLPIEEVPRTLNGKKVEMAVTRVVHGQPVPNRDALANPEALDQFADIPELRD
jgi:acetoacetyl-CoA synthetase